MTAPNANYPYFRGFGGSGPTRSQEGTPYGEYWGGKGAMKGFQQGLSGDLVGRTQREQNLSGLFDQYLENPTSAADLYGKYFQQAAEGYAAPALRDFTGAIKGVSANTARRFGGNASTEENRQVSNAGDMFSRNLTESLAQLAPEQVAAGQAYGNQLGTAQANAAGQSDTLKSLLLASLNSTVNTSGTDWGQILGKIGGTIAGTLIGGPAGGAIGSQIGGSITGGSDNSTFPSDLASPEQSIPFMDPMGEKVGAGAAPWAANGGGAMPSWMTGSGNPRLY